MSGSKPGNLAGPMRFPLPWYCTARALPKYCTYVKVAFTNEHCKIKSIIATALRKLSSQKRRKLGFLHAVWAALNWNFLQVRWGYDVLAQKGVCSSQVLVRHKFILRNATLRCQKSTHHLVKNYAPRLSALLSKYIFTVFRLLTRIHSLLFVTHTVSQGNSASLLKQLCTCKNVKSSSVQRERVS